MNLLETPLRTSRMYAGVLIAVALFFACATARADSWIPYTDGRTGGCWINTTGYMYGCTPQPESEQEVIYIPTRDPRQDEISRQTQRENAELRSQLDEARSREMARRNAEIEQQQRAAWDAELQRRRAEREAYLAWLATPEGQTRVAAENRAADAQRAAATAKMNVELDALRAKPRSKARQAARGMEECSRAGGVYTCSNVGCLCD